MYFVGQKTKRRLEEFDNLELLLQMHVTQWMSVAECKSFEHCQDVKATTLHSTHDVNVSE